jgi:hypothetical protein
MDCLSQSAICINPLLKMGRLRVFLYPALDQIPMDLAQKTQRHGVAPFFPICLPPGFPELSGRIFAAQKVFTHI